MRSFSASPARKPSGRRVINASVRHGPIPPPDWSAIATASHLASQHNHARTTLTQLHATQLHATRRLATTISDRAVPDAPEPLGPSPPPARRRFSQLDAVLQNMRTAVDSVAEFYPKQPRIANSALAASANETVTVVPAFFRRHSASAAAGLRSTSASANIAVSTPGGTVRTPFRGVQMHERQSGARVSALGCRAANEPPGEPESGVIPPARTAIDRRGSRCSAGCASVARPAASPDPEEQRHQQQPRPPRPRSRGASPLARLDTNARLALLLAALPSLGIDGACASTTAPASSDPHALASRLRWANNLRSYAWHRVCDRCAGLGEVIGVNRTLLPPAAAADMLRERPHAGSATQEAPCSHCGQAVGSCAVPAVECEAEQLASPCTSDAALESDACPPAAWVADSEPRRGRLGSATGAGLVGALRAMSEERSRARQSSPRPSAPFPPPQLLISEPHPIPSDQSTSLPVADAEILTAVGAMDAQSGGIAAVSPPPPAATAASSRVAQEATAAAATDVVVAGGVGALTSGVTNAGVSAPSTSTDAFRLDHSTSAESAAAPAPDEPPESVASRAPPAPPAPAPSARARLDESTNTSMSRTDESSFAQEIARAASTAFKRAADGRRAGGRLARMPASPTPTPEVGDERMASSSSSSVQEAVLEAIKSRLRALRQASGGSIDLAGVRDRVLDSLYKQQLASEERRGRRTAQAREQERVAAVMAARFIGERIRSESAVRRAEEFRESDGEHRRQNDRESSGSRSDDDFPARTVNRGRRHVSKPRESHRDLSRGRSRSVSRRRTAPAGHDNSDDSTLSDYRHPPHGREAGVTSKRRSVERPADDTDSEASSFFSGARRVDATHAAHERYRHSASVDDSPRGKGGGERAARRREPARPPSRSGQDRSSAASSAGSSLFLSGPSTNYGHPRTPLFHNVEHVLHARREMVSGMTPSSERSASIFAATEGASGPELLAARARALGFVAGNMFGASATGGRAPPSHDDPEARRSSLQRGASAPELRYAEASARGPGLSYIGSLGASIPRHELQTPSADRASFGSSTGSTSERAAQQFMFGLGVASTGRAAAGRERPPVALLPGRSQPHVPFPQGLLLPTTSAAPHVSLQTLADREQDIMGRWPATMAAAAEMQLRAQ